MKYFELALLTLSPIVIACPHLPEGLWQEISAEIPMTLDISTDHHLSAYAGCNRIIGSVSIEGSQLVVKHLASTRMACFGEAAENEKALIKLLTSKPEVQLHGKQLILSTDTNSYIFSK